MIVNSHQNSAKIYYVIHLYLLNINKKSSVCYFLKYKMLLYKAMSSEHVSLLSVNNWTEIDRLT